MSRVIYYAHSKRIYNTKREQLERNFLEKKFKVLCPNRDLGELGTIDPYLEKVRSCSAVICSEYRKHIGRGVFEEIQEALAGKKQVSCLRKHLGRFKLLCVIGVELINDWDWQISYGKIVLGSKSIWRKR